MYAEHNQLKLYSSFSEEVGAPNHPSPHWSRINCTCHLFSKRSQVGPAEGESVCCVSMWKQGCLCALSHMFEAGWGWGVGEGGEGWKGPITCRKTRAAEVQRAKCPATLSFSLSLSSCLSLCALGVKSPGPGTLELPGPEGDVHLLLWLPTGGQTETTP